MAELYHHYGERFPYSKQLWKGLEREEQLHAKALEGLHDVIDQGYHLHNIGQFIAGQVEEEIAAVEDAIKTAKEDDPTEYSAIMTAMSIEGSLLDTKFYQTVTCDAPAYQRVAEIMLRETQRHVERIEKIFQQVCQMEQPE